MMTEQHDLYLFLDAFITELARSGVQHVCISPGSRSTPLALVLANHPEMKLWLHIDERSAGFFALGLAKATNTPVALVCTSGTAAANYLPAVVEAYFAHVPLVVLTADRPHELRDCGAPQTIDQCNLYGHHVKWFADMATPEASPSLLRYARIMACRAASIAGAAPTGPVHLNFPFREPLVPLPAPATDVADENLYVATYDVPAPLVQLTHAPRRLGRATLGRLAAEMATAQRGIIICGAYHDPELAIPVTELGARLGFPVLADPLSQVRCSPGRAEVRIDTYDAFLRDEAFSRNAPDFVLRIGAIPTSKPALLYLQQHAKCRHIVVGAGDSWNEPTGLATDMLHADPVWLCRDLVQELGANTSNAQRILEHTTGSTANPWLALWQRANHAARGAINQVLCDMPSLFEGRVFTELAKLLPADSALFAGNSMPVRDMDTFFPAGQERIRFYANRGANGIDGVVSSALGAAAGSSVPLVLVIGDLSFTHDLGGLLAAKRHGIRAVVVLVNNNGGGIFSFLPQAAHPDHFEALFGTPTDLDFRPAVEMYGGNFVTVDSWQCFRSAVQGGLRGNGLTVVEVKTDRSENVRLHQMVWQAVAQALRHAGL